MCLHAKNSIKTADKDIKCYKILQSLDGLRLEVPSFRLNIEKANGNEYLTPYLYFPMHLGETYTDDEPFFHPYRDINGIADIGSDYFHSFATIEDAVEAIGDCEMSGAIVVECVIPEGTKYFEGSMFYSEAKDGVVKTYASKTLKLTNTIVAKTNCPAAESDILTLYYGGEEYRVIGGYTEAEKTFATYWIKVVNP